jgi:hypothetical protein
MQVMIKHANGTEVEAKQDMAVWVGLRNRAAYIIAIEEDEHGVAIRLHTGEVMPPSVLAAIETRLT